MSPAAELAVLAEAQWPEPGATPSAAPPPLPGFVLSSFNPLAAVVAERCLSQHHGPAPAPPERGERTAVVIVSASGDAASHWHVRRAVAEGTRVGPLFFFQSVPNSVAGHVAARWGLGGPVVCVCPVGEPRASGLGHAALLLRDGDADEVLLIMVEQAPGKAGQDGDAGQDGEDGEVRRDGAAALLVGRGEPG